MSNKELFAIAVEAMKNAYAPYSKFTVGAALVCTDGDVFTGCNIENTAYPVTCCAERAALFSAVSAGKREFKKIMIVGGINCEITDYTYPCGLCRQAISEFCGDDFTVMTAKSVDDIKTMKFGELLPYSFKL